MIAFSVWNSCVSIRSSGSRVPSLEFRVQSLDFRCLSSDDEVQSLAFRA